MSVSFTLKHAYIDPRQENSEADDRYLEQNSGSEVDELSDMFNGLSVNNFLSRCRILKVTEAGTIFVVNDYDSILIGTITGNSSNLQEVINNGLFVKDYSFDGHVHTLTF